MTRKLQGSAARGEALALCNSLGGIDNMLERFNMFKITLNRPIVQRQTLVRYINGLFDGSASTEFQTFVKLYRK